MARAFKLVRGSVKGHLEAEEIELLRTFLEQLEQLIGPAAASDPNVDWARDLGLGDLIDVTRTPSGQGLRMTDAPEDPALQRLLPDGHRDDPLASAEFRSLTQRAIKDRKLANLQTTREVLNRWLSGPQRCTQAEGWAMATALTDIRLVLAQRLGLETDEDTERLGTDPDSPTVWLEQVYDFLTWLQEVLMHALGSGLNPAGDGSRTPPPGLED